MKIWQEFDGWAFARGPERGFGFATKDEAQRAACAALCEHGLPVRLGACPLCYIDGLDYTEEPFYKPSDMELSLPDEEI